MIRKWQAWTLLCSVFLHCLSWFKMWLQTTCDICQYVFLQNPVASDILLKASSADPDSAQGACFSLSFIVYVTHQIRMCRYQDEGPRAQWVKFIAFSDYFRTYKLCAVSFVFQYFPRASRCICSNSASNHHVKMCRMQITGFRFLTSHFVDYFGSAKSCLFYFLFFIDFLRDFIWISYKEDLLDP